ncbi:MAG: arsenate reductase family protein [Parachlamydiaceae bacterium]
MTITVYVYSKCSTCQKALQFLKQHRLSFQQKEITLTPPSLEELKQMLRFYKNDIKKLFNTSGILYREMQLSSKLPDMSESEALHLLTTEGMLVKRPFLLGNDVGLVGFREAQWMTALKISLPK